MSDHEEIELSNEILKLQSQLTASQARVKELQNKLEESEYFRKEEHAIVQRVWKALGKETYRESKPFTIWEWVEKDKERIATLEQALRQAEKVITQTRQINLGVKVPNEWFILRDKALTTISTALKDEISLMGTLHPAIQSMAEPALRAELAKPLSIHSEHPPMSPCDHDDCPATECLKNEKEGR